MDDKHSTEPTIWHCDCMSASEHNRPGFLERIVGRQAGERVATTESLLRGFPVERSELTDTLRTTDPKFDQEPIPDFFNVAAPVMSEAFADVLRGFELGEAVFFPIDIYYADGATLRPEKYFIMNLRSQKTCVVFEESHQRAFERIRDGLWMHMALQPDGRVAVNRSALDGPDLWYDPRAIYGLFFSDRLKRAVEASGLAPHFRFFRCKLV
ncbi:MAG: DUF1629 domain-containing protein [Pseudomonadota bacterium]